ncbi:alpha-glucosidase [Erysipelothrix sp. HDW6C]|uniref:alpha-glucosidase n=1 Tax=Erysipelothrix sp. HDW6C TaxID=2714930 RepID=UPI00140CBDBD|nr:alpha-glucosidase [Erysipelothrix sp. HDW6C]QIK69654.1 alpha-glucosidase [Erysipelothrix sp. HDW6C]
MNTFTLDSKVKDVLASPIGKDVINKVLLQLGLPRTLVQNPVVGNMKLNTLKKIGGKNVDDDFFIKALELLNTEHLEPRNDVIAVERKWWKEAVFYQIYPRSFMDSNGDGIGDINGIIAKLDYLKFLGIDALWLSPIYDSPNDDNGYDIRNYHDIMADFGTLDDFKKLLEEVHKRDMRIIMDLVVNHTSDEHPWFQSALEDTHSPYRDYYFLRPNTDGTPPNNWTSFFSGSAWNYYPEQDLWGMHLFSKKQMDLNWDNSNLRQDIITMVKWWLEMGVDGFRLDVINYISKREVLPNGSTLIGEMMEFTGIEQYFYGPKLHTYLHQLNQEAFKPFNAFSVGETPGIGMEMAKLLTGDYREELDMVFNFDHLETPGHVRFNEYRYDLNYYKSYIMDYQNNYGNHYWMSLFYENHDNPRMISKIDPNPLFRDVLGKLLAGIQLTLKGTPFIFQGQEIGMVNQQFRSLDDLRDVESINKYHELIDQGMSHHDAFHLVLAGSRDHARTPVQWNATGGFSQNTPWILSDDDCVRYNVEDQSIDPHSILSFYRQLIALRKDNDAMIYGETSFVYPKEKHYLGYYRKLGNETFFIQANLSNLAIKRHQRTGNYQPILSNYTHHLTLMQPYEINIFKIKEKSRRRAF